MQNLCVLQRRTNTLPLRHWHSSRLTCYQHRAWCQAHDFFCHTSQEDVLESSSAMGAHDNEIHLLGLSRLNNFMKRYPVDHGNFPFEPSRGDPLKAAIHTFHNLGFQILDVSVRDSHSHIHPS